MEHFSSLHKNLEGISKTVPPQTSQPVVKEKWIFNIGKWSGWWKSKLKVNQQFIQYVKQDNYEKVAQILDKSNMVDTSPSLNYQEPGTGFTPLHYAV